MIQAIKQDLGMNVIMDVVYNHTNAAGPTDRTSVLDKIVLVLPASERNHRQRGIGYLLLRLGARAPDVRQAYRRFTGGMDHRL